MFRMRTRRRRRLTMLVLAIAALVVLIFSRDVSRAAHADHSIQAGENLSFAQMADVIVAHENLIGTTLNQLVATAPTMGRAPLLAALQTLDAQAANLVPEAAPLRSPALQNNVAVTFVRDTDARSRAYRELIGTIATELSLPWTTTRSTTETPSAILTATGQSWATAATLMAQAPGHPSLSSFLTPPPSLFTAIPSLTSAPHLALNPAIGLAAVSVTPAPFPSPAGTIELIPVPSFAIGVSVRNYTVSLQPVTVTATLTLPSGAVETRSEHATIGPSTAYAFASMSFAVSSGQHDTLTVAVSGAPAAPGANIDETYHVVVAPA